MSSTMISTMFGFSAAGSGTEMRKEARRRGFMGTSMGTGPVGIGTGGDQCTIPDVVIFHGQVLQGHFNLDSVGSPALTPRSLAGRMRACRRGLLLSKTAAPRGRAKRLHPKGGVAEWSIASVLKTEVGQLTVGSNPTPSALLTRAARPLVERSQFRRPASPMEGVG